ncbi:hypothetical protein B566_EDAN012625 [Ephemera danica]|nr:hypothetical protein B566_EDAN012625 [Ephemera danica]
MFKIILQIYSKTPDSQIQKSIMEEDKRFAHISSDPKFRRVPLRERKVKIDKRFQAMFKDSRFKVRCSVDKRGRPTAIDSRENLRRYYNLSSSDESSSSDDEEESADGNADEKPTEEEPQSTEEKAGPSKDRKKPAKEEQDIKATKLEEGESVSSEEEADEGEISLAPEGDDIPRAEEAEVAAVSSNVRAKLRDLTVDYARGGGLLNSDHCDRENLLQEVEHAWGELDKDAETTEESTSRLAVCNMDWDRVRSEDLMVLLSSFLPAGGAILRAVVYPSDFGLQCMKEEESMGPKELATRNVADDDENDSDGEDHFNIERLRSYELRRLRYYYAVVECDSVATASHLYSECDGLEYESSSAKLDLRFIPDDTKFEHTPRDECSQLPDQNKYRPQFFEASALCKSKFELSWDATDPRRVELSQRVWATKDQDVGDDELKAVLASSRADKYRALLQGLDDGKGQEKEMEVTWGVGLQEQADKKAVENRRAAAGLGDKTPFEEMMERKRQRKKEKRLKREKQRQQKGDGEAAAFSDDEIPEELADLKEQLMESGDNKRADKKKKKSKKEELEVDPKQKAELELLLMDEAEDEPRHFNLDTRATKSKKKKEKMLQQQDDFKVDVEDSRFSALYTSHHFNVDPADKHYRVTPGTQAFVNEKQRRRQREDAGETKQAVKPAAAAGKRPRDAELSMLVRNVKRKTEQSLGNKRKRH